MIYDNSKLQQFKNCPESYRLKYILGLEKIEEGEEEHDRNFGSAIHTALESYYKGEGNYKEKFKEAYPTQLNETDLAKTQENGLILLDKYIEHYKVEDKNWTIKAVEVKDTFQIAPDLEFQVKIDLIVEQQGCIYFVDHKTTGKTFNWNYWEQYDPSSQVTAYTAYCVDKFGKCSGGIINALQLGFRQRAYKGEEAGFHCAFQRQLFNRNQQQIDAWKKDTIEWITLINDSAKKDKNISLLKNEGQCRFCSYKPICISVNDDQVIEQLFKLGDPNDYLK